VKVNENCDGWMEGTNETVKVT